MGEPHSHEKNTCRRQYAGPQGQSIGISAEVATAQNVLGLKGKS